MLTAMLGTVEQQYVRGHLQIAAWAHIVNAHLLPGPAIITALHAGARQMEKKLAQTVLTEIFVGTPEMSEEEGTDDEPNHHDEDDENDYDDVKTPSALCRPSLPSPSATSNSHPALNHHHKTSRSDSSSVSVRATTTIYRRVDSLHALDTSLLGSAAERAAALHQLGEPPNKRALLVFAQMSSADNRMDPPYTQACVEAARDNTDFVMGYIAQENLNTHASDNFIIFTPGVNMPPEGADENGRAKGDGKGQQYRTPQEVVTKDGCDVVIVGRGILKARDRKREAERYRKAAWDAYQARLAR